MALMIKKISIVALILLIAGSIDNIRNLPMTALFGPPLIFFFVVAAIVFLIPVALIAAELASTWPDEEGGIYSWVQHGLGQTMAFFAVWLQWINTMVWYPTILLFIAGTLAYLINPTLAQHKTYLIIATIVIFWSLTLLSLHGLHASARFSSACALIGMILPMVLLISFSLIWFMQGHPLAIHLTPSSIMPQWAQTQSWSSLTAIITSFLGIELAAVHVNDIQNPQHNFPRAIFFAVIIILTTMILGSLAVACMLQNHDISLLQGVMQAFMPFLNTYHLTFLIPFIIVMLLLGSLGNMINWIISPAKGLLLAAHHGFLPQGLYRTNRHGVAYRLLILQASLVTLLCAGYVLLPSVNGIYWLFSSLSTELYLLMYVIMFIAAIRLKMKHPTRKRIFSIPGGRFGYYLTCLLGLIGCAISLAIGFMPPDPTIDVGGANHFRCIYLIGLAIMILPAVVLTWLRKTKTC